jgi:hypothetical protein
MANAKLVSFSVLSYLTLLLLLFASEEALKMDSCATGKRGRKYVSRQESVAGEQEESTKVRFKNQLPRKFNHHYK